MEVKADRFKLQFCNTRIYFAPDTSLPNPTRCNWLSGVHTEPRHQLLL